MVLAKISGLDKGDGVKISKLIDELKMDSASAMEIITDLMMKGELYEPKKGVIRKVD